MKYGFNFGWVWDEITHLAERPKYLSVTVLATSSKLHKTADVLKGAKWSMKFENIFLQLGRYECFQMSSFPNNLLKVLI